MSLGMLALNGYHDRGLLVKLPVLSQPPGPGDSWSRAAWLALALVEFTAQGRPHSTQRMFYNMRLRYVVASYTSLGTLSSSGVVSKELGRGESSLP